MSNNINSLITTIQKRTKAWDSTTPTPSAYKGVTLVGLRRKRGQIYFLTEK